MHKENIFDKNQKKYRHLNLARFKKGGEVFEIDIEPELAMDFKKGKDVNIKDVLKAGKIFSDAKNGMLASEEKMKELFDTEDVFEIAKIILKQGEMQLTTEQRNEIREVKRKKIISLIHINAIDPKTGLPHPMQRIEAAMEEAKVKIDEFKAAEEQIDEIMSKLKPIIPIKFDTKRFELEIKNNYAKQCMNTIKSMAKVERQDWDDEGNLVAVVKLPAGLSEDFFDKLNSATHGTINTKIL